MQLIKKTVLPLAILSSVAMQAQVKGNAIYEKNVHYDNAGYNNSQNTRAVTPPPTASLQSDGVVFDIHGISNQKATSYVVMFSITQTGATADTANKLLQDRYEKFVAELQKLGIAKENIFLDMVSFVPVYEYEVEKKIFSQTNVEVPKGFEIQQNVHIKYKDGNLLTAMISAAARCQIYDIIRVDYTIDNQEQVVLELQQKTMDFLKLKMKDYEKIGYRLDTMYLTFAEQNSVVYPTQRYSSYTAFTSSPLESARGKVANARKAETSYYDRVPYNNFDVVINPTILEPSIQFMYNLRVMAHYHRPSVPTTPKKEFIWVTPQGTTQVLKIE